MRATHHQSRISRERPEDSAAGQRYWHGYRGAMVFHTRTDHSARGGRFICTYRLSGLCVAACAGGFHRLDHLRHPTKTPS